MSYINQYTLIQTMVARIPPDSKTLLADVKRTAVLRALERSKDGVPQPVTFTNKPMEEEHMANMRRRHKKRLWAIYECVRERPQEVIPELLALRQKYPDVPAISNYLGIAYMYSGQETLYYETLLDTVKRFPTYLFGKTSLGEYYLNHQQHQKVKEVFEGKFELRQHYPTTEMFHVSEVRSFFSVVGSYFVRTNNLARALYHYCMLVDVEPEHPATKRLGDEIILKEIEKLSRKMLRNTGKRRRR
ncbi:MAG: hypothetical protein JW912_06785 [Sedimentisphaerales bacterium]|nr:hypothetical protein [Sedimentisphaerales bacterium]